MKRGHLLTTFGICSLTASGLVALATLALHHLSGHAAWFTDTMFKKGGLHEMTYEELHAFAVKTKWEFHSMQTRYLVAIAILLAVIGVLFRFYSIELLKGSPSCKPGPNQPLQGTPAKAPSSSTEPDGRRS